MGHDDSLVAGLLAKGVKYLSDIYPSMSINEMIARAEDRLKDGGFIRFGEDSLILEAQGLREDGSRGQHYMGIIDHDKIDLSKVPSCWEEIARDGDVVLYVSIEKTWEEPLSSIDPKSDLGEHWLKY